jgi:hypothetical protein
MEWLNIGVDVVSSLSSDWLKYWPTAKAITGVVGTHVHVEY